MPGLSNLNDKNFLRAFQVTDAVIQNNQPLFMFTWIGSILSVLVTILVSLEEIYIDNFYAPFVKESKVKIGLKLVEEITINSNNTILIVGRVTKIKTRNELIEEDGSLKFETKWNFFNYIRTSIAISVSVLLLIILTIR